MICRLSIRLVVANVKPRKGCGEIQHPRCPRRKLHHKEWYSKKPATSVTDKERIGAEYIDTM